MGDVMSTYLIHHGIKGMKWGVRRFQNKDGSYTQNGKERRRTLKNRIIRTAGIRNSKALREARSKNIDDLSLEELRAMNNRLSAEEQYVRLTSGSLFKARDWVDRNSSKIVTGIAVAVGTVWLRDFLGVNGYLKKK